MENSVLRISRALLDLATFSDAVLHITPKARTALKSAKLDSTQLCLLERIDGFRSLEQLLAMSGDLIAVHAALGKLLAAGLVVTDTEVASNADAPGRAAAAPVESKASGRVLAPTPASKPVTVPAPVPTRPPAPKPEKAPSTELDNAKHLLLVEAKLALGKGAEKLRGRIESCDSIAEIFDLIVKVQEYLATSGKANPDVFIDRLTSGLAAARKPSSAGKRAPV